MRLPLLAFLTVVAAVTGSAPSTAMTVTPTQIELRSSGRDARGVISVVNNSDRQLAVELVPKKADYDEVGTPSTTEAGEEFLIMPPQALIAPGATQNFRIQWLGEPLLARSESFLIFVNEIPLKSAGGNRQVQLVYSIGVMVNVAPPRGEPSLGVVDTSIASDGSGRRHPAVTVYNPGAVHALFSEANVFLSGQGWSYNFPKGAVAQSVGSGLVLPGHRRRFILPIAVPSSVLRLKCDLTLETKR
jgi:fimbrial chaperone protein